MTELRALKEEAKRVFSVFPIIEPATYNGNPTFKQYSMTLYFPLNEKNSQVINHTDFYETEATKKGIKLNS